MIAGLQRPDSGEVRVAGRSLTGLRERELGSIRKGIGMLFQNGALLDSMTVLENVGLPLREHTRQPWRTIRERVTKVLSSVGLEDVEELMPRELSGGMLRRVAFARAIVMEPSILLCDEPFSGLDPPNVSRIESLLLDLNQRLGLTVLVTSHHMASSLRLADYIVLIRDQKALVGTPHELASSPDSAIRDFMGADGAAYLAAGGATRPDRTAH
jgi:phospholipid/cholesterol/gamma-HCH transport system ATP-binding protein